MGLVRCPECGRSGVSDKGICPGCGCHTEQLLKKLKYEEAEKRADEWEKEGKCRCCGGGTYHVGTYKKICNSCGGYFGPMDFKKYNEDARELDERIKNDTPERFLREYKLNNCSPEKCDSCSSYHFFTYPKTDRIFFCQKHKKAFACDPQKRIKMIEKFEKRVQENQKKVEQEKQRQSKLREIEENKKTSDVFNGYGGCAGCLSCLILTIIAFVIGYNTGLWYIGILVPVVLFFIWLFSLKDTGD